ncbi:MAG: hypothetical protein MUE54_08205 [Anaerolineae bacterium]|nr:hypothetical protein [Anaerolineae bacterium]
MKKLGMFFILIIFIIIPAFAQTTEISAELEAQLTAIEIFVSENRGLPILEPVPVQFITRQQARDIAIESALNDFLVVDLNQQGLLYRALGFVSDANIFAEAYVASLGETVVGFYLPELGGLNMILPEGESLGDNLSFYQQSIYAHEFLHALQDQHFEIPIEKERYTTDQFLALRALIEGDANLVQRNYVLYGIENNLGDINSLQSSQTVTDALPIMKNEENLVYIGGLQFVMTIHATGGWDAVNAMYANLPQSSEQILQPAKYIAGDMPIPVELADISGVLGDDWQLGVTTTIGQFYLSEYLSPYTASSLAYQATNGWGGDTMSIYQHPNTNELAWALGITWDAPIEKEQREFSDLYTQIFEMGFDIVSETPLCGVLDGMTTCFANTDTTTFITSAPTTDLAQALLTHVTAE